jgi:transcriptional regulator with XRE-family HTH domain
MGRRDKAIPADDTVGAQLRRARQAKGISLTKMAQLLGYTKGHLSAVENDTVRPSQELIKSYEQVLASGGEEAIEEPSTSSLIGEPSPTPITAEYALAALEDPLTALLDEIIKLWNELRGDTNFEDRDLFAIGQHIMSGLQGLRSQAQRQEES